MGDVLQNLCGVLSLPLRAWRRTGALREAFEARGFPGLQPLGAYPIHIIVKNGRTTLVGVVDNSADRQIAEVRAREVSGVFAVDNNLTVSRK